MADFFLSPILSPVLDLIIGNLASEAIREVQQAWGVDEELEKLESRLSAIRAVLEDEEDKQVKSKAVSDWLQKLKDVAYDTEDLVDEFEIEAHQQSEMEGGTEAPKKKRKVSDIFLSFFKSNKTPFQREMACRIEAINGRLDLIAKEQSSLGLIIRGGGRQVEIREHPKTSSLIDESEVFGRGDDEEKIIESLLFGSGDHGRKRDVSVTSIVGMGGLGKTTLAQFVYNDERVAMHFELRAWVCVSEDFDVKRLTKEIIESAASGSTCGDLSNIDPMQRRLQEILNGKKFLLVLDDVWNDNYSDWEQLRAPLKVGVEGSKILVTTSHETVSAVMQSTFHYRLERLSDENCLSLFTSRAFADGDRIDDFPELSVIAQKIVVDKCDGLPWAAKALGGLLYAKRDRSEWEGILNSEVWNLTGEAGEILPALRLSYYHLPAHLKRCFAFCSIYPKDYEFKKDELVLMWISNGFIHPKEGKRIEDTGGDYFDELWLRSFFQYSQGYGGRYYTMHDLMHDSAKSISGSDCFRMEESGGNRCSDPRKVRHLFVSHEPSNIEVFYKFKSLRTLLMGNKVVHGIEKILPGMFEKLRFLRVLDLSWADIRELPNSISNLKHLRYLDLQENRGMKRLPESITSIYCLQTINLDYCRELVELPKETRKLKNLRNLHLNCCNSLKSMPREIGKLTHLQNLSKFVVGREAGQSIAELKEMNKIRDIIKISNLENVTDAVEAMQAELQNKPFLTELALSWNFDSADHNLQDERAEEEVLEALQPHSNLKRLRIEGYMGTRFPSWIVKRDMLLADVNLYKCGRCNILPPLGQLPFLKYLIISGLDQVKKIGHELCGTTNGGAFPLLDELTLHNMPNLEEWCGVEEGDFPCLRMLYIESCPKLRQLSHFPLPSSLENMSLFRLDNLEGWCGAREAHFPHLRKLEINCCPNMTGWPCLLLALTELKIVKCHGFVSLPPLSSLCNLTLENCNKGMLNMVPKCLTSLSSLSIRCTNWITSLPQGMLQALVQLKRLCISSCQSLVSLLEEDGLQEGGLPSTLTFLDVSYCPNLKSLPSGLHLLPSLEILEIYSCPQLSSLPEKGLPTSLRRLWTEGCPMLKERCLEERGEDWSKISHIPLRHIN